MFPIPTLRHPSPKKANPNFPVKKRSILSSILPLPHPLDEIKSPTTVGYGQMYPPPPTNSSILQASVNYFMSHINYLGQETTVITGYHPNYGVLMNIKKKYPERFVSIVVRLDGFYVAVNFMGTVGHLMKGSGTEELLVEISACNEKAADKVLNG